MPIIAAGAALVGAGIQVYGAIKSADDQSKMDLMRADIARQQSAEIEAREAANETLRNQTAIRQQLQFGAAYAASGKAGVGIGSQLQIQQQVDTQNMVSAREAAFQEKMLQQQAGIDTTLAQSSKDAGLVSALGAGVGGIAAGARTPGFAAAIGFGGPQGLGAYPGGMGG